MNGRFGVDAAILAELRQKGDFLSMEKHDDTPHIRSCVGCAQQDGLGRRHGTGGIFRRMEINAFYR